MTALRRTHSTARAEKIPTVTRTEAPNLKLHSLQFSKGTSRSRCTCIHVQGSRPRTGQSEKVRMMERTTWDLGSLTGPTPSSLVSLSLLPGREFHVHHALSLCLLLISRDEHSLDLLVGQQLFTLSQSVSHSVSQGGTYFTLQRSTPDQCKIGALYLFYTALINTGPV